MDILKLILQKPMTLNIINWENEFIETIFVVYIWNTILKLI